MGSLSDSLEVTRTLLHVLGDLARNLIGGSLVWPAN